MQGSGGTVRPRSTKNRHVPVPGATTRAMRRRFRLMGALGASVGTTITCRNAASSVMVAVIGIAVSAHACPTAHALNPGGKSSAASHVTRGHSPSQICRFAIKLLLSHYPVVSVSLSRFLVTAAHFKIPAQRVGLLGSCRPARPVRAEESTEGSITDRGPGLAASFPSRCPKQPEAALRKTNRWARHKTSGRKRNDQTQN